MKKNKMKTIPESELYSLAGGIIILPGYRLALWSVKIENMIDKFLDWWIKEL